MMRWRRLPGRPYLLIAALAITFLAGTLSSTAYATFRGPDIQVRNFSVTYAGVTGPMDSIPQGLSDLVLTQASGKFVDGQRSQMTVSMERNPIFGTRLSSKGPCAVPNVPTEMKAWCVDEARGSWAVMPLQLLRNVQVGDTLTMWGPSVVKQIVDGEGYEGLATYKVTFKEPADTATEGAIVIVNIDGYVSKVKPSEGDRVRSSNHR